MNKTIKKGLLVAAFTAAAAATVSTLAIVLPAVAPFIIAGGTLGTLAAFAISFSRQSAKKAKKKEADNPSGTGVPLTAGEKAYARSIFGEEISEKTLNGVKKYFRPNKDAGAAATAFYDRIDFYGSRYHSTDYSQTKDAFNYGTFIHEMTHILQQQHTWSDLYRMIRHPVWSMPFGKRRDPYKKYHYRLTHKSRFKDFGTERQAAIIEDYARLFLFPEGKPSSSWLAATPENKVLLQKVVEEKFPEARKTRLRHETEKKTQAVQGQSRSSAAMVYQA